MLEERSFGTSVPGRRRKESYCRSSVSPWALVLHDTPGEGPDREQDPEEVPCAPDATPPTLAGPRGQRSGKGTSPVSAQGRRSYLPAARHRYPAGTAPREDQSGYLSRSHVSTHVRIEVNDQVINSLETGA